MNAHFFLGVYVGGSAPSDPSSTRSRPIWRSRVAIKFKCSVGFSTPITPEASKYTCFMRESCFAIVSTY
jgi:hypothetical protein